MVFAPSREAVMLRRDRRQRRRRGSLIVDDGRVRCSLTNRDVEIDRCFACPAFEALVTEDGATYLTCRPVRQVVRG
jgi:hypothetical protein